MVLEYVESCGKNQQSKSKSKAKSKSKSNQVVELHRLASVDWTEIIIYQQILKMCDYCAMGMGSLHWLDLDLVEFEVMCCQIVCRLQARFEIQKLSALGRLFLS